MHKVKVIKTNQVGNVAFSRKLGNIGVGKEYRVICDKCGLVEKAGTETAANLRAERHRNFPHR